MRAAAGRKPDIRFRKLLKTRHLRRFSEGARQPPVLEKRRPRDGARFGLAPAHGVVIPDRIGLEDQPVLRGESSEPVAYLRFG